MFSRIGGTTTQVIKSLLLTATAGVTTYFCHENIQKLRVLDPSSFKNGMKDSEAQTAFTANALLLSVSGVELIGQLISTGVWSKLSTAQRLAITTGGLTYLGGAIYLGSVFGSEHNTMWAGLIATGGILGANVSSNLVSFFANRLNNQNQGEVEANATQEETEGLMLSRSPTSDPLKMV